MYLTTIIWFIIGFLDLASSRPGVVWAQAILLDVYTFVWQMSLGAIAYVIFSEISSTRLRSRTVAFATSVQALFALVFTIAMPYMLSPEEGNWRGKAAFLFSGVSFFCCFWCFFRIPESKGRTYEELDLLFEKRVPPRHFKSHDLLEDVSD